VEGSDFKNKMFHLEGSLGVALCPIITIAGGIINSI